MADIPTLAGALLSLLAALFFLASAIGVVRLPDFYCRMHAPTKAATLGLALLALGSLVQGWSEGERENLDVLEDLLLIAVVFITLPLSAQALARSARKRGIGSGRAGRRKTAAADRADS